MNKLWTPIVVTLALAGCSKAPDSAGEGSGTSEGSGQKPVTASSADLGAPPSAFAQCAVCHKAEKGAPNGLGPSLFGVVGRKAGVVPAFTYSPAMKASGLTWDEATIDRFITKPQAAVPGTRMSFAGVSDAAKRAEIIAWLNTRQ